MTAHAASQRLFNNALFGIRSQNYARSVAGEGIHDTCRYRGINNLRCSLGWSIPDDKYLPIMEEGARIVFEMMEWEDEQELHEVACQVTTAHDEALLTGVEEFEEYMCTTTEEHNLTYTEIGDEPEDWIPEEV